MQMEKAECTMYKHNSYQATVAASAVGNAKKVTFVKLPTASGKTYIGGMLFSWNAQVRKL